MDKYEEALERAKEIYGAPTATVVTRTFLEQVFPELKQSEDEKIRTRLIALVEAFGQGKYKDEMLACLERHKGQKSIAEEVLIRAGLKPFKDGNQWCILAGDNIQEGVCGFGDTIEDALFEFLKDVCKQNKPAEWSALRNRKGD